MPKESMYAPAPPPPTLLGRYRNLSKLASVLVSPIQIGAMSIGDKWNDLGFAYMDKDQSFKLLDAYYEAGGNFIDTANFYQDETSEQFIGEWMEKRKNRDHMVIATKYTTSYKRADPAVPPYARVNYLGNGAKSLRTSVRDSLLKLRTDYIDILYVHWWGFDTSIPEVMGHLHDLVAQGKVLYLGVSDTPAWIVSQANQWAVCHGKTPFSIYQGKWNVMERDFERDIIPMAREWGMALAPFGVLASGKIRTDEEEKRRKESGEGGRDQFGIGWERTPKERELCLALEKVAKELGSYTISAVAIAYVLHKAQYVFPVVGGRKVEHLMDNIKALEISLSQEQIDYIDSISPLDLGFPHNIVGTSLQTSQSYAIQAPVDKIPAPGVIRPIKQA